MEVDLQEFARIGKEILSGDRITFLDSGVKVANKFPGKFNYNFLIRLPDGRQKMISLNKTSMQFLVDGFGNNTDLWIGKQGEILQGMTNTGKPACIVKPVMG